MYYAKLKKLDSKTIYYYMTSFILYSRKGKNNRNQKQFRGCKGWE